MIPKINGQAMQYIGNENSDYGVWEMSFNHGVLDIRIYSWEHKSDSYANVFVYLNQDQDIGKNLIFRSTDNANAQVAADQATKYLNRLENLLKNCGFSIDK